MNRQIVIALLCFLSALSASQAEPQGAPGAPLDKERLPLNSYAHHNDVGGAAAYLATHPAADVNAPDLQGVRPLHVAAALDHTDMVLFLIGSGADVSATTTAGFQPLHWAASRDAFHAARALIANGAEVGAATHAGITPMHWAAGNNATNVLKLFIAAGAPVMAQTENGYTPLHWSMMQNAAKASFILAYQAVTEELENGAAGMPTNQPAELKSIRKEEQRLSRLMVTESSNTPPPMPDFSVRPEPGSQLVLPLGRELMIPFVWIEPLRLWIAKYEVTNDQFRRFDPAHDSLFRESYTLNNDRQPVVRVSWHDAVEYCSWLNGRFERFLPQGYEFRLPGVNEWTVVAQCGDNRPFPWGDSWPPEYGNYSDLTAKENLPHWRGIEEYRDGYVVTCPVENSGVNEWGVYGLAGNVWEWCGDWYSERHHYKVRLGGSWDFDTRPTLRIDHRGFDRPDAAYDTLGFRLVAAPAPAEN